MRSPRARVRASRSSAGWRLDRAPDERERDTTIERCPPIPPTPATPGSRLAVTLALMTIGSSGMYVVAVVLPAVQAEFGVARADASLPYTLLMIGFGLGGIADGQARRPLRRDGGRADRRRRPGRRLRRRRHVAAASAAFALAHGLLIGALGSSATFAPLVADTSLWFVRRRGIAVAICASGNYLGRRDLAADRAALRRDASAGARPTSASASSASLTMPLLALLHAAAAAGSQRRRRRQPRRPARCRRRGRSA